MAQTRMRAKIKDFCRETNFHSRIKERTHTCNDFVRLINYNYN